MDGCMVDFKWTFRRESITETDMSTEKRKKVTAHFGAHFLLLLF